MAELETRPDQPAAPEEGAPAEAVQAEESVAAAEVTSAAEEGAPAEEAAPALAEDADQPVPVPEPLPEGQTDPELEAVKAAEEPALAEDADQPVPAPEPLPEGQTDPELEAVEAAEEPALADDADQPVPVPEPLPEGQTDPELEAVEAAVVIEDSSIDMDALLAGAEPEPAPLEDAQLRAVLEAIIYVAEEPLTLAQLAGALAEPPERVRAILGQVIADFEKPEHGVTVREVAGGYKMATKPEHHDAVRSFVKSLKPPLKLSLPALETLAVIAYKQPVTAPEIMEIRGVQGAGVLKTLLDRKLIAGAGRKNVIGKPILYKTTKEFLIQFGLKDLSELPSLKEFEEIRRMAFTDDTVGVEQASEPPVEEAAGEAPPAEAAPETPAEPAAAPAPDSVEGGE
jgi:segregation and condensation protein B